LAKDIDALLVSACRTPIGSFGGGLKDLTAADLGAVAIREALARAKVTPAQLDDVLMGCVLQAGAGMNVARQAAQSRRAVEVPAETIVACVGQVFRLLSMQWKVFAAAMRTSRRRWD
jgi:acetyl-CoA C-acetyltransferase